MAVHVARIYDATDRGKDDGSRVLVDRVWPRGVAKDDAHLDHWLKEVGPSSELRKWFGHDPEKFAEFRRRYRAELRKNEAYEELQAIVADNSNVTLLYGAKDAENNQAVVLAEMLEED